MSHQISYVLVVFLAVAIAVVTAFSPADHYLIDCGTTEPTVDLDHRKFTGDGSSPLLSATKSVALKNSNPDLNLSPIYHTARVFTKPSDYKLQIKEKGMHLLESKNRSGGQVGRLLSLTAAVCLLAVAFLFMRRKTEAKDSAGWSRLPVDMPEIDLKSIRQKSTEVNV